MLLIDAANVIGSRPDGWWRDRPGAARRLLAEIDAALAAGILDDRVVVVLEGRARPAARPPLPPSLHVVPAPGSGDDAIVSLVSEAGHGQRVTVVTADRRLIERVRRLGADVEAPKRFLNLVTRGSPGGNCQNGRP